MEETMYVRRGWPEYQEYIGYENFEENSEYCNENDCYYIDLEWLKACDNGEVNNTYNED